MHLISDSNWGLNLKLVLVEFFRMRCPKYRSLEWSTTDPENRQIFSLSDSEYDTYTAPGFRFCWLWYHRK